MSLTFSQGRKNTFCPLGPYTTRGKQLIARINKALDTDLSLYHYQGIDMYITMKVERFDTRDWHHHY